MGGFVLARDAVVKVRYDATGVVKVSTGVANYSIRSQVKVPPSLSIAPNFKDEEDERTALDFPTADDVPLVDDLKPGWGLLGNKERMSLKTSKNVRRRMCATEYHYGKENCLFITLTIPTDCKRGFELIARYSSKAVNAVSVWLNDRFGSGDISRVGVWEYQKRGALHYHMLIGGTPIGGLNLDDFRKQMAVLWISVLERVESEDEKRLFLKDGEVRDKSRLLVYEDLGKRFANVQRVEHSVSGYLSWYLSGSNHESDAKDKNQAREDNYSIATWAQWNRKSTELDRLYSYEIDMHVDGAELAAVEAHMMEHMESMEKPEGTGIVVSENNYYRVWSCISSQDVAQTIDELRILCPRIRRSFKNRDRLKARISPWGAFLSKYSREADYHDYSLYKWEVELEARRAVIEPFIWHSFMMYLQIESMGYMMDKHKRFSSDLSNSKQMELKLCLEK